jgi:arylsulfatase A-like enzyme
VAPAVVTRPVGLVDLAPTFCEAAGLPPQPWMEGAALPVDDAAADSSDAAAGRGGRGVVTEWDSEVLGVDVHLRTITRDGWVCTTYGAGTVHDGSEGELYDLADDPLQRVNLWDDAARRPLRDDLVDDLRAQSRPARTPRLPVEAPV